MSDRTRDSIIIAGHWDLGWNTPIMEIDLWKFPLQDFGVSELYMCPISGIQGKVKERKNIEEVFEENSDHTVIFCDERANTSLINFQHPEKALYVFGKANFSPFLSLKREQDLSIKIDTKENKGLLWGHQAVSIILYDRLLKSGNNNN